MAGLEFSTGTLSLETSTGAAATNGASFYTLANSPFF